MNLTCHHCGHEWNYTGDPLTHAITSCTRCYYKVRIPWVGTEQRRLAVRFLALIVIMALVIPGLVMAEDIEPIINEGVPVVIDTPLLVVIKTPISVRFELLEYSTDFLKAAGQRLGLIAMDAPTVAVIIDEGVVAVIPEDSKFVGITPTEGCLRFSYGTDLWYTCEASV